MGSIFSLSSCHCFRQECYLIELKTGDMKGHGGLNRAYIKLITEDGNCTDFIALSGFFLTTFKRGSWDRFAVAPTVSFHPVFRVIISRNDNLTDEEWYLDQVRVARHPIDTGGDWMSHDIAWRVFPVNRLIMSGQQFTVDLYDCFLPQNDCNRDQRLYELNQSQTIFRYYHIQGLPPQAMEIPKCEIPSDYLKFDLHHRRLRNLDLFNLHEPNCDDQWPSLTSMVNLFKDRALIGLRQPLYFQGYTDDKYFAFQRLAGCLPTVIEACASLPEKVSVNQDEIPSVLMDGMKLEDAIKSGRIFHAYHDIVEGVKDDKNNGIMPVAYALFYSPPSGEMMRVVGIQFIDPECEKKCLYTPNDHPEIWTRAKMWFNLVDSTIHRSSSLMGCCHMILESITISVRRQLSRSHVVHRLLMEVLSNLFKINNFEIVPMTKKNGFLDRFTNVSSVGAIELIHRSWSVWRMDLHGWLPADLKARKVDDERALRYYPFRDDALKLFFAYKNYISKVLSIYYETEACLLNDWELQNWAEELVSPDGANLKGVFGNGKFRNMQDLVNVITSIYYQSLILYVAQTLNQYDHYAIPMNYPSFLLGNAPYKNEMNLGRLEAQIAGKKSQIEIITTMFTFSQPMGTGFGDLNNPWLYHPEVIEEQKILKKALKEISTSIKMRNSKTKYRYLPLDPSLILN